MALADKYFRTYINGRMLAKNVRDSEESNIKI